MNWRRGLFRTWLVFSVLLVAAPAVLADRAAGDRCAAALAPTAKARLYSKGRLEALLSGVGFSNLRVHRLLAPDSCRNQDLGMMAHRLFVTCEARRHRRGPRGLTAQIDPVLTRRLNGTKV